MPHYPRIFTKTLNLLVLFSLLMVSIAFPGQASADSTISVTTTADELNADGDCSLREAIQAANEDASVDACAAGSGVDTIVIPSGTYTLTLEGTEEDGNTTGDLDIVTSLILDGESANATIIRAGDTSESGIDRVLDIFGTGIIAGISDITIANGNSLDYDGGGIFQSDDTELTVTNSIFSNNYSDYSGGAIYSMGEITITNSVFSNNSTYDFGGSIYLDAGNLTLTDSTFAGNAAYCGGGIYNNGGTVEITNSTFQDNSVECIGGGIANFGMMSVTNSTFSANAAINEGGGIFNSGDLAITNSTFSGNSAQYGGGIYNYASDLHLQNTILANSTDGSDCFNELGTIATNINNLIETNSTDEYMCDTPSFTADPSLGLLIDSPAYFTLNSDSPAIDAGDDTVCAAAPVNNTSQNGMTRPFGAHCDIGSYETSYAGIDVTINTNLMGTYDLTGGQSMVQSYSGTNGGPVVIESTDGSNIIASLLQFRRPGTSGEWTDMTQVMGLTDTQISDSYVFPRYDFSDPKKYNSIQIANFDSISTNVTVTIGGVLRGTYPLTAGSSQNVTFPGVTGGPVVVSSDNNANIIASLYELKRTTDTGLYTGQTQMMGLPETQLSDTYIIPRYNYTLQDLLPYVVFANAGNAPTSISVTIGGVLQGSYDLDAGQSMVQSYSGVNGGPVVIQSDDNTNIIASLLQFRRPGTSGEWTGMTQVMGRTDIQISDSYVFPYYDFSDLKKYNSIQLANFDSIATNVTVTIGGVLRGTYPLAAGSSLNVTFPGVTGGPVVVKSDNAADIIASLYELKRTTDTGLYTGQTQMMGLPETQLSDTYIIPRYNYTLQDLLPYVVFSLP